MSTPRPRAQSIVRDLPDAAPFLAAEALERIHGVPMALRLGANESPFGPSPQAVAAMERVAGEAHLYGDPDNHELIEALAATHEVAIENVFVAAGIDEVLAILVRAWFGVGDRGVATLGTYPMFRYLLMGQGGELVTVPYRDSRIDAPALAATVNEVHPAAVYIANPDNPSASQLARAEIRQFLDEIPDDVLVILDEAYAEFGDIDELLPMSPIDPRVVRLRTFSKVHGLAGARVGYAIADRHVIDELVKIRLHFSVNRQGQAGALAALGDREHFDRVVRDVAAARDDFAAIGDRLGIPTLRSWTNFVLFDIGSAARARDVHDALIERGCFVRLPWGPPLDRCFRITVAPPTMAARFAELLEEVIARSAR